MTPEEIAIKAEQLRNEQLDLSDDTIGMGNYQKIRAHYDRLLNDHAVLIRELAKHQMSAGK